ncbi:hypothetical protein OCU04_004082 [Sclerotinia nivalis]|uniref:Uncharacterized protein n=1 Tax=Sclerotinia nivalis TaxID=352851 RepID=A0A9X0AT79_9HELO|nr:hypothetical protein OCU04_004082 [Sclerotinia nivalis]
MASSAGSKRLKTVAESLFSSEDDPAIDKLAGVAIPPETSQNLMKMAPYLGLSGEGAVGEFLRSNEFLPTFKDLYQQVISPRTASVPNFKGPSLKSVQSEILRGETYGDRKYSACVLNMSCWEEIDHYALCLHRLCCINSTVRNGLFFRRQMSTMEMEVCLWMCIVRATADANRLIVNAKKRKSIGQSVDIDSLLFSPLSVNIFGDSARADMNAMYPSTTKSRKIGEGSSPRSPSATYQDGNFGSLSQAADEIAGIFNRPPPATSSSISSSIFGRRITSSALSQSSITTPPTTTPALSQPNLSTNVTGPIANHRPVWTTQIGTGSQMIGNGPALTPNPIKFV